jgi:hypothetical protein
MDKKSRHTTEPHWRIAILDFGCDGWRWHVLDKEPVEFSDRPTARKRREVLRILGLRGEAVAEAVKIPAGAVHPDMFLGNIEGAD